MRRALGSLTCLLVALSILPASGMAGAAGQAGSSSFTATRTVTRDVLTDGTVRTVDRRTVSLSVDQTTGLRGLQQINVSWSGAHPTAGGVSDPNGPEAPALEYPMVLLECRGVDSPSAPAGQRLDPTTCWTAYEAEERHAQAFGDSVNGDYGFPPWRLDMYATPDQRKAQVGLPDPNSILAGTQPPVTAGSVLATCPAAEAPVEYSVPLVAADGSSYYPLSCSGGKIFPVPSEAQSDHSSLNALPYPSNETYAQSGPDGTGGAKFTVLTSNENASLGCSDTVACSLVAIPVLGISCDGGAGLPAGDRPSTTETVGARGRTVAEETQAGCSLMGTTIPGKLQTPPPNERAVQGSLWWAASNWRNRITVPLGFAPVADACGSGASRSELDIYGSELMTEASAQWDPHFCKDPSLFTLKHIQSSDVQARNILAQGTVNAAYASFAPTGTYSNPVVKAPVALTGFGIGFSVDDNAGHPVTGLRLNARLLAKLLTQSYPDASEAKVTTTVSGSTIAYPPDLSIAKNPLNITQDPEFLALNPQMAVAGDLNSYIRANYFNKGLATLFALSSDSDVMYALTSYIANDPEASAWLNGTPDPWGMVVNANYNQSTGSQVSVPTNSWRLLDPWINGALANGTDGSTRLKDQCPGIANTPYQDMIAAPQSSLIRLALAVQVARPYSSLKCADVGTDPTNPVYQLARDDRQAPGSRFTLGLVSLGEASRYGLQVASLQTQAPAPTTAVPFAPANQRSFAGADNASLLAAARLLAPDTATGTWQLPANAIPSSPQGAGAYPGAMVVYTQVPTKGLKPEDATNLAKFLRFAAGDGQSSGVGYGQLPDGYLPMTSANAMGGLAAYTRAAAEAVAAQAGAVPPLTAAADPGKPAPSPSPSSSGTPGGTNGNGSNANGSNGGSGTGSGTGQGNSLGSGNGTSGGNGSIPKSGANANLASGKQPGKVTPPAATKNGPGSVLGRTIGALSALGSSLQLWLFLIACAALLAAGTLYLSGRRQALGLPGPISMARQRLARGGTKRRA